MKKQFNILVFIFSLLALPTLGQSNYYQNTFEKANSYYAKGKYDSAITYYQEIERAGLASFELYFNIGNTAFKLNNLPLAILNYERASKIQSNDKDLKHNLDLANDQITDKIEAIPKFFLYEWISNLSNSMKSSNWAWLNLILFFLFLISLSVYLRIKSTSLKVFSFYGALFSLFLVFVSLALGIQRYQFETNNKSAIVFQPSLTVKSEPSENSTDLFLLHEGTKIKILEATESWSKISLPDGNVGWVKSTTFEII